MVFYYRLIVSKTKNLVKLIAAFYAMLFLIVSFAIMFTFSIYKTSMLQPSYTVSGPSAFIISSFTEFLPFCNKVFYFSSYKDFKTLALA